MQSAEKAAADIQLFLNRKSGVEPELEIDTQVYNSLPSPQQTPEPSSPGSPSETSKNAPPAKPPKGKGKTIPEKTGGRQKRKSSVKPRRSLDTVCIFIIYNSIS